MLAQVCFLVLLALFSGSILAEVIRAGRITADKIYGAICFYLLIGFAWAFVYAILEQIQPGSFSIPEETGGIAEHVARIMRLRYFSFVTLTTLGFRDHSAIGRSAKPGRAGSDHGAALPRHSRGSPRGPSFCPRDKAWRCG